MKKYIPVFGPQDLFDGAPEDSVIAIKRPFIRGVRSEKIYFFSTTFDAVMMAGSCFNFNNVILKTDEYAERRIIKEPNRWTWENKKAGWLPEVGCRAIWHDDNGMKYTVKIETAFFGNECAVSIDDEAIYFAEKFCLFPIETPTEKAQREEDEFVDALVSEYNKMPSSTSFKAGIRAACRKMKGGE